MSDAKRTTEEYTKLYATAHDEDITKASDAAVVKEFDKAVERERLRFYQSED